MTSETLYSEVTDTDFLLRITVFSKIIVKIRTTVELTSHRRSPGEGNDNPLQCSCLGNPMDRGAWKSTVHGVAKSQTRLSN